MPIIQPFAVRPVEIDPANIATGNEITARPASNLTRLRHIGMTWRTNGAGTAWVRGQLDAAGDIDFVSLINANALPGTTIRVRLGTSQAQVDGSAPYDSGAVPFISPATTRESGMYHSHLELPSIAMASWFRIDIGGHTGDFEAAGLVMGKKIQPARFYDRDFEYGIEDLGSLDIARNGVSGETPGLVLRTLLFRFSWMTKAEFETEFRPMIEALASRKPSFWCFNPEANAYRQNETYFGYFGRPPFARGGAKPQTFTVEFQIRSLI